MGMVVLIGKYPVFNGSQPPVLTLPAVYFFDEHASTASHI
jgi:hypothetical protein